MKIKRLSELKMPSSRYQSLHPLREQLLSDVRLIAEARKAHVDPSEKWKYGRIVRLCESGELREKWGTRLDYWLEQGWHKDDLLECVILEYTAESPTPLGPPNPADYMPSWYERIVPELDLKRLAEGRVRVADYCYENYLREGCVTDQLRAYLLKQDSKRVDEVAAGTVEKSRFLWAVQALPETFYDLSAYKPRYTGGADCSVIALAVSEGVTYSVAAAMLSDKVTDDKGIRGCDLLLLLSENDYLFNFPPPESNTLERFWDSACIDVKDSGVIVLDDGGEKSHCVGYRNGQLFSNDPGVLMQRWASAEVLNYYKKVSHEEYLRVKTEEALACAAAENRSPEVIHEKIESFDRDLDVLSRKIVSNVMEILSKSPEFFTERIS